MAGYYLTQFTAADLGRLDTYASRQVDLNSRELALWLCEEIDGELLRRKRNRGRRIPREPSPLKPPVHLWGPDQLGRALRAVVIHRSDMVRRHTDWGPLFDSLLFPVAVACSLHLTSENRTLPAACENIN